MKDIIKKFLFILPKGDAYKICILFMLMILASIIEVAGIGMIPAFVAIVAAPERVLEYELAQPVLEYLEITDAQGLLIWGSGMLVGIFLVKSAYILMFNYIEAKFIFNRRYSISFRMMRTYMMAPYTFHLQRNTSELIRNTTGEISILINNVLTKILTMSRDAVMAIAILSFLIFVEPLITLFVFFIMGIGAGIFIMLTQKKVKRFGEEEQAHRKNLIKTLQQGIGGIKEARVLNREDELIERFRIEAYKSTRLLTYMRYMMQVPKPLVETSAVLGMMMISAFMIFQGRPMSAIIPILALFAIATVRLMPTITQLSSSYTSLKYNLVALDPIYEDLLSLEKESIETLKDRRRNEKLFLNESIRFNDVTFLYPESSEQALRGVTFEVPKGKAVAFVGSSGAGKTTVVDLLLGLLKPKTGLITVDGLNIQDNLSGWQRNIGYIPQTIYLSDETLRENVAFGMNSEEIEDDKVMLAIERAQLTSLLQDLPEGLDTIIGENGTRLSGGQRQRVGIARALYHEPEVLVMDEATSALDNITEQQIIKSIEDLKGERTIITIAHRLTTVMNCDKLYLMEKGKIIQEGSYPELLQKSREFREMALEV